MGGDDSRPFFICLFLFKLYRMDNNNNRTKLLRKIKDEVVNLYKSPLYKERIKNRVFSVIGEGSYHAKIMFIGEAPGKNEAKTGRPFCGASGKILDELLASVGIDRKDVYITNIVKDRPPLNRDPLPKEIKIYGPFLDRQIDIIQPEVIATLGRFSMDYIMKKFGLDTQLKPISQMHGKVFEVEVEYGPDFSSSTKGRDRKIEDPRFANRFSNEANRDKIKIMPLYHPAVAIYNRNTKAVLTKDFQTLRQFK